MPKKLQMFPSTESLIRTIRMYLTNPKATPAGKFLGEEILEFLKQPQYAFCSISELERKVTFEKWRFKDEASRLKAQMEQETDKNKLKALKFKYKEASSKARQLSKIRKVILDNRYFKEEEHYG